MTYRGGTRSLGFALYSPLLLRRPNNQKAQASLLCCLLLPSNFPLCDALRASCMGRAVSPLLLVEASALSLSMTVSWQSCFKRESPISTSRLKLWRSQGTEWLSSARIGEERTVFCQARSLVARTRKTSGEASL